MRQSETRIKLLNSKPHGLIVLFLGPAANANIRTNANTIFIIAMLLSEKSLCCIKSDESKPTITIGTVAN